MWLTPLAYRKIRVYSAVRPDEPNTARSRSRSPPASLAWPAASSRVAWGWAGGGGGGFGVGAVAVGGGVAGVVVAGGVAGLVGAAAFLFFFGLGQTRLRLPCTFLTLHFF